MLTHFQILGLIPAPLYTDQAVGPPSDSYAVI